MCGSNYQGKKLSAEEKWERATLANNFILYKDLKDSHVIFICMEAVFDNGLPVCTFENICMEDKTPRLNDRAYKHFFIVPHCAKMIKDKEVKSFFELLLSNTAKTSFTSDLKEYVADAKHNMQWRVQFMTWERQRAYDFADGKEAGIRQKAIEDAFKMLKKNYPLSDIAEITGLAVEEINKLQTESGLIA